MILFDAIRSELHFESLNEAKIKPACCQQFREIKQVRLYNYFYAYFRLYALVYVMVKLQRIVKLLTTVQ